MDLGNAITTRRKAMGLTQKVRAGKAGVGRSTTGPSGIEGCCVSITGSWLVDAASPSC